MVRILITNDSQAKSNVVRQLEPWSSIALNEFLLYGIGNAVLLIGSVICDAVCVPSRIVCVCVWEQTTASLMASVARPARKSCVDEHINYSCDCVSCFTDGSDERVRDH